MTYRPVFAMGRNPTVKATVTLFALAASEIAIRGRNDPVFTIMACATPRNLMAFPMG
jgi:hypothetical protein